MKPFIHPVNIVSIKLRLGRSAINYFFSPTVQDRAGLPADIWPHENAKNVKRETETEIENDKKFCHQNQEDVKLLKIKSTKKKKINSTVEPF
jgi:hypothetical protein